MKTIEYIKNIIALGLTDKQQEYYDFLLENGKTFEVRADHFGVMEHVKEKQCFNNSFLTAIINANQNLYLGEFVDLEKLEKGKPIVVSGVEKKGLITENIK